MTRTKNKALALLLSLAMVFTMMPMMAQPAYADAPCTLTIHWSSIDGVDVDGHEAIVIDGLRAGMNIETALSKAGLTLDDLENRTFKEKGYYTWGPAYTPVTDYTEWSDWGENAQRVRSYNTLNGNTHIYVHAFEELDSAQVTVTAPLCGTKTTTAKDAEYDTGWDNWSQTNQPQYSFPAGLLYGEVKNRSLAMAPTSFWYDGSEERRLVPFVGTFEGGKTYSFLITAEAAYGYVFPERTPFWINGAKGISTMMDCFYLTAASSEIDVVHMWDAGRVTRAATTTTPGVKTYTCSGCKGTKTVSIPKLPKKDNPLSVKGKTATVKGCENGKLKKNKTLAVSKLIRFTKKGKGKMSYTKASGNKKISINKKSGKLTVKKGIKKGIYKVKIKVRAAGNDGYKASKVKTVTVKLKVK